MSEREIEVTYYDNSDVHIFVDNGDRCAAIRISNEDAQRLAEAIQHGRVITIGDPR